MKFFLAYVGWAPRWRGGRAPRKLKKKLGLVGREGWSAVRFVRYQRMDIPLGTLTEVEVP